MSDTGMLVRWGKYDAHAKQKKRVDRIHIEFPDDRDRLVGIFGEDMRVSVETYSDHVIVMRDPSSTVRINRHIPPGNREPFFVLDREGTDRQCPNLHRLPAFSLAMAEEVVVREESILVRLPREEDRKRPKQQARGAGKAEPKQQALPLASAPEQAPAPAEPVRTPTSSRLSALKDSLNHAIAEARSLGFMVGVAQARPGDPIEVSASL